MRGVFFLKKFHFAPCVSISTRKLEFAKLKNDIDAFQYSEAQANPS